MLVADTDKLTNPLAEPWAEVVRLVQQKGSYSYIVAASNSFGKNVLPRAAALLDVQPITDIIEISEPRRFVRFTFVIPMSCNLLKFQRPVLLHSLSVACFGIAHCILSW